MLDDHREQFGEDLTQDAPRLDTARLVNATVAFPQFKEEVDLPARAQQDEGVTQGQQRGRDAGDHDGPVAPRELGRAGRAPPARGLRSPAATALVGHLRGDAHGEQRGGQALVDAEGDVSFHRRCACGGEQV